MIFPDNSESKRERKKRVEDFTFQLRKEQGQYKKLLTAYYDSTYKVTERIITANENETKAKNELEALTAQFVSDSTTCFWQANKGLMSKNETKLDYRNWLKYFDKNDSIMNFRFLALSDSAKLKDSCKVIEKRVNFEAEYKKETAEKMKVIMTNLAISSFGIYNCDQLSRIQNPVAITANYINQKNDTLEIKNVYLIDKSINGVIVLNGYNNMTPNNFSYGKYSSTTLICFDKNANPWLCDAKSFSTAANLSKNNTVTFKIRPIGKSDSKASLLSKN